MDYFTSAVRHTFQVMATMVDRKVLPKYFLKEIPVGTGIR